MKWPEEPGVRTGEEDGFSTWGIWQATRSCSVWKTEEVKRQPQAMFYSRICVLLPGQEVHAHPCSSCGKWSWTPKKSVLLFYPFIWQRQVFAAAWLSLVARCGLLIVVRRLLLGAGSWNTGSAVGHLGFAAPQHVASSQTRDRTGVARTGRQILIPWTTREGQNLAILIALRTEAITTLG